MTDQQKNPEVDKENEAYASDESLFPNNEMKPEKRVGTSAILSFALFIAIAYTVLLLLGLFSMGAWAGGFLYFLGIHMISFVIATILLWNGKAKGNKTTLYIAAAIYVFSFIAAGDPDWVINHIPPLVVGVLVLIGTVLFKNGE
ncbi:hypothetical protein O3602_05995 [Streptococcus sp. 27098_8_186]|uniref:Uncharacterized protein n=3 Tax=Streptococcus TaxID=1301 RepID=A0A6A8V5K2_STRPA|nr:MULTISPECIES: hypothetical protein [Streptococcus]EFQ55110.1 hypothetical protein HMPREF9626_1241 [Streptococcus parasanguinis F0405]MTR65970.1 hypothetical protein [Streptococcus parasanguinis]MTR98639.1 hypothetical protein [Streptococcus parasanguinis]MTS01265.1 hypothetical protein [Streptococcus parasanguinis]MTS10462.1 hypothetical protein [Streptococcus parasanguinis]